MNNNIVAYIDLLAFSNHLRENTSDALMAMNNYNTIMSTKIRDDITNPVSSYSKELQELAKNTSIDSISYFLPFSDSVFLMSSDCNRFLKQLGDFVLRSFTITADFYRVPMDPSHPEKGKIINFKLDNTGNLITEDGICNYYPAIFRGGLAYGESFPVELFSKIANQPSKSTIITGKAVVDAVKLESSVKGPRLVFEQNVYDLLDTDTKIYCRQTHEKNNLYEILWPALLYIKQNGGQEYSKIDELLLPAYNLWKAYNHTLYSSQYFNLIELIIASTIQWFDKSFNLKTFVVEALSKNQIIKELSGKIDLNDY